MLVFEALLNDEQTKALDESTLKLVIYFEPPLQTQMLEFIVDRATVLSGQFVGLVEKMHINGTILI